MIKDKSRFYFDMFILIGLAFTIYYLRVQATGESFNPFDGVMAFIGVN